jgi:hypothetical protein
MNNAPITPWVALSADSIEKFALGAILDAMRSAGTVNIDDKLPGLIAGVTVEIRNRVASFPGNPIDSDPSLIPPDLECAGSYLVIQRLCAGTVPLTDDQKEALKTELRKLDDVAAGKLRVAKPASPAIAQIEPQAAAQGVCVKHNPFKNLGRELL